MDNYPEKLVNLANNYLKETPHAKIFHYDVFTSNPYKDKSITDTTYRIYVLYGNYFKVYSYCISSNPEWNFDEVKVSSMIAWEIKECYEKGGFFK